MSPVVLGAFVLGVLVGIILTVVIAVWERRQPVVDLDDDGQPHVVVPAPREPLGVRHDRLDAEARVAAYDATVVPKPRPHLPDPGRGYER